MAGEEGEGEVLEGAGGGQLEVKEDRAEGHLEEGVVVRAQLSTLISGPCSRAEMATSGYWM